jgi:hypothetical protein
MSNHNPYDQPMPPASIPTYQLRVTLLRIDPPIWRQLHVPPTITLRSLHRAIQESMGWEGEHLHEFAAGNKHYGIPMPGDPYKVHDETEARLYRVLTKPGQRMMYEYDFGDGWKHEVLLEAVHRSREAPEFPVCIAGERACPPEDCGGPWGYEDLLELWRDAENPEDEERLEWLGEDFDPEAFDLAAVNEALQHIR